MDQSEMMNRKQQEQYFINIVKKDISDYRANVIGQKYGNNLEELEKLLADLQNQINLFVKEKKGILDETDQKRVESEIKEAIDYINLIASEMEHYLSQDESISSYQANVLILKNNYIKNITLRDELKRQLYIYENASKKVFLDFKRLQRSSSDFQERFSVIPNAVGRKKYILKEYESSYQKLTNMVKDVDLLILEDMKSLEKEQSIIDNPILLDIVPNEEQCEKLSHLTLEEMQKGAENCLNYIHSLEKTRGLPKMYHFSYQQKLYKVAVPAFKLNVLSDVVQTLKSLEDLIKIKTHEVSGKVYNDLYIDYYKMKNMTFNEQSNYLRSVMEEIEKQESEEVVSVLNVKGENITIPAYYYRTYMDCIHELEGLAMSFDDEYFESLSNLAEKISYCDQLMARIQNSSKTPRTLINGVEIPSTYARFYYRAQKMKNDCMGYSIDQEFVESLSSAFQKYYYQDLIIKISKSPLLPKIGYELMGEKLNIPTAYVSLVKECEERIVDLNIKRAFAIDSLRVSSKKKISLYEKEIKKIKESKLEPKISVTLNGKSYQIPEVYQKSFVHCFEAMKGLSKGSVFNLFKKFKIKKIRKPRFLDNLKSFWKNSSRKVQIAMGMTAFAVSALSSGIFLKFKSEMPNKNIVEDWNENNNVMDFSIANKGVILEDNISQSFGAQKVVDALNEQNNQNLTTFVFNDALDKVVPEQPSIQKEESKDVEPVIVADQWVVPEQAPVQKEESKDVEPVIVADQWIVPEQAPVQKEDTKDVEPVIVADQWVVPEQAPVQKEQNPFLDEWSNTAQQTMASELGGTFMLNSKEIYENPYSMDSRVISANYENSVFTTVGVSIKMPDGSLKIVSYVDENAKEKINEYLSNGGYVERVSAVAAEAEESFLTTHFVTGCFDVNQVKFGSYVTDLSEKITDYLEQGKGVSR